MRKANIQHLRLVKQDAREGIFTMNGLARTRLIHSIIREYGKYSDGNYSIDINTLSLSDKRLLISHFVDAEEYEWAHESPYKTEAVFKDNEKHMQGAVDDECFDVYKEDMEEMGMQMHRHFDNNEPYWTRR